MSIKGIDVSGYQGTIDWEKAAAAGVEFAILKIIRKDLQPDKKFEANYAGCTEAGVPVQGVYNYSYATTVDKAKADAERVIEVLNGRKAMVWLDVEDSCQKNLGGKTVKKPYSAIELERIRKACETPRDLALVEVLYSTGCRVSELSRMDIDDVDFEKLECKVLGKGNKERMVYLSPVAAMHLQEYLEQRKGGSECLFIGRGNRRIGKNGIEALLKRIGQKAGVENVHPHRFRRTLATNLLDRGMNIQDVAAILGHSDLKTTQIYCYISQSNVRSAYHKFAA